MPKNIKFTRRPIAQLLASTLFLPTLPALAAPPVAVASGSGQTAVYTSANGVTVVNINTANGAGLSHNKFTDYNVPANGVVLNNGNSAAVARQSQLAGLVAANKNLGSQAAVILNEVVSANRSLLAGYTEVLGGRADVVVANPNGITCSGCGFINTNRVSLVTGTPNLTADGGLRDFSVSRGDLLINGAGLDASAQQYLDLVSRSVKVDGQINAPVLRITTGNNVWNYGSALVTGATTPEGAIPAFAFDSTVLGGMYAGRIAVVATESGVGVRMLGQAAATADDFSIDAVGRIAIGGKLSAARDLKLASTSSVGDAIALTDASLSAKNNLELTAAAGGATLTGGVLVADNTLTMALTTLTDVASASAITDNNKRYAGNALNFTASGAASLDGVSYGAGSLVDGSAASFAIGSSAATTLYSKGALKLRATTGDLTLANAALSSAGDMALASDAGALGFGSGALVKSAGGNLALTAATGLTNDGKLATDTGDIVVRVSDRFSEHISPSPGAPLTNTGEIKAGRTLDIADKDGNATNVHVELSGNGKMGATTISAKLATLTLKDSSVLTSSGDMSIVFSSIRPGSVASGAKILAATGGSGTLSITGRHLEQTLPDFSVDGSGQVHSGWDMAVSGLGIGGTSGGTVSAANNLSLQGYKVMSGNFIAGHDLSIASSSEVGLMPNGDGSPNAIVYAGNDVSISGSRIRNWSTINAGRDIWLSASGKIDNAISDSSYASLYGGYYFYLDNDLATVRRSSGPAQTPQIIAGNSVTINSDGEWSQNVGVISAPTVTISAANYANAGTITGGSVGIGVKYGGTLTNVAGSTNASGTTPTGPSTATVPTPGGISFGGVVVTLPTSPNGLYVPAQNPKSGYLIESNPLFLDMSKFIGSDYLKDQLTKPATSATTTRATVDEIARANGFNAEIIVKRLGDAAYETYLVRQQLIALTGSNIVSGFATEYAQMKGLMDHAVSQVANLGLTYGQALSVSQQAGLKEDMVWMVETTVNGQKVLAPVVYLSAATRQLFDGSATVAGDSVNMNVSSLTNFGTIRGNSVDITASDDVRNVGGTIKGGEVSVASTGGSVINTAQVDEQVIKRDGHIDLKTTVGQAGRIESTGEVSLSAARNVENVGGSIAGKDVKLAAGGDVVNSAIVATNVAGGSYRESVAASGSIVASNDLTVAAGRDVQNLGAQLTSGGDATLVAGRGVVVDTAALTNRETTTSSQRSFTGNSNSRRTTTAIDQVQGGVGAGGVLAIKAGQDVTLAAATVSAGQSVAIDAARDLNIVARERSTQTISESNSSGVGVGGGLYGEQTKTSDQFSGRAVGSQVSTVKVGGSAAPLANAKGSVASGRGDIALSAGQSATLEGAKVSSAGATSIAAQDVLVLAAKDVDRTTTTTETTSYLSTSGGEGDKSSALTKAGVKSAGVVKAGANASATKDAGGVDLVKTTTTTTFDEDTRSVASQLTSEGGLSITAKNDITLQGADVKAGGDVSLSGQNVSILAAQDTHVSTSSTTTTKVGLYASTTNAADAKAGAGATAGAAIGSVSANAGASATANAGSSTSIDVLRSRTTETESVDITNQGSSLAAGGTLKINSAKTLTVQGSDLAGEKSVELKAKDMAFVAAQDIHTSSTSTTATNAGLYLDGNAAAGATANANANAGVGANAGAKTEAGANAGTSVGVQGRNVTSNTSEGSSTARVSTITSGSGSITRQAENGLGDVGTVIDAAGDFSQSAKTITSQAAENTSFSSSDRTTNTAKVGVYAKADVGVSADAGANAGLGLDGKPKAEAGANAEVKAKVGVGVKASYAQDTASSGDSSREAVVSTIRAGGKLSSLSSDKTRLEGTQVAAGAGGVEIQAASLDFAAAQSTTSSASSTGNINASASAGVSRGTGKGVDVDVAAGTSSTSKRADTSTATAGSITTTGDLLIKTTGDTRLEGAQLAAIGDTTVAAGGNLVFDAARDTASSSKSAYDASASVSTSNSQGAGGAASSGVDASVAGGFSHSSAESSAATAGSINTGGKLTLSAGKAASFEGAAMTAGGDATVSANDGVTISAARSTSSGESYGARVGVSAGSSKESTAAESSSGKSVSATVEGNYSNAKSSTAQAGSLTSGGSLKIVSGKDVNLEGTNLAADGKASIQAGGAVNFTAAESASSSIGVGASLSASAEKTDKTPAPSAPKAAAKNPGTGGTQGSDGSKQSNADLAKWQKNQASVVDELKSRQSAASLGAAAKGNAPAALATDAASTTESKSSASLGVQAQTKNSTVQKAGSITAGTGGVEVVAAGGNVNLVGTNISTAGDADISARGDVNISATRSTSSGINVAAAASADRASEVPTGKPAVGAKPAAAANAPANTGASSAKPSGTSSAASSSASTGKKTPPPVPAAPKPERKSAGATPSSVATTPAAAATNKKTPPPVPTAPKPARQTAAGSAATPAADKATVPTQDGAKSSEPATTAAPEKGPKKLGASVAAASNTDENKSSTFVGVGGGGSVKNQGATIQTGGKVNIRSGGKTRLTNTEIKADGGQNIDAGGGVERKIEKDTSVLNASTDSGPASAGQGMSKVPTASANPATGAPAAPGTPGMASTDSSQGTNAAPQSALNAAQGKSATPAIKKN